MELTLMTLSHFEPFSDISYRHYYIYYHFLFLGRILCRYVVPEADFVRAAWGANAPATISNNGLNI